MWKKFSTLLKLFIMVASILVLANNKTIGADPKDLSRKEAERIFVSTFKLYKSPVPQYLLFYAGKVNFSKDPQWRLKDEDFLLYNKLQQLNLIHFTETGERWLSEAPIVYEVKITEERKNDSIEVKKEELEIFGLFSGGKWYKTKLFSLKFAGCTGIRNFKEKNEAIADFDFEFVEHTNTFFTTQENLKKVVLPKDLRWQSGSFKVFLRRDWLIEVINDPKTRVTSQIPFALYDDGWRHRPPKR